MKCKGLYRNRTMNSSTHSGESNAVKKFKTLISNIGRQEDDGSVIQGFRIDLLNSAGKHMPISCMYYPGDTQCTYYAKVAAPKYFTKTSAVQNGNRTVLLLSTNDTVVYLCRDEHTKTRDLVYNFRIQIKSSPNQINSVSELFKMFKQATDLSKALVYEHRIQHYSTIINKASNDLLKVMSERVGFEVLPVVDTNLI